MQAQLVIVDPGHFHATLLQKEMYPELADKVAVYARLGPELLDYLNRIYLFNSRPESPTRWRLDVHTSDDPMAAMLAARPGNVAVFTGRNLGKIDRILAALDAGLNVLADKPWIITPSDLDKLDRALDIADRKGLIAYDIMTERYEVTSELQRVFVNSPELFGRLETGTPEQPAIRARSVHYVMKLVAGVPLRRPSWFFDTVVYGEALADVGTHVVDLVQWTAFPDQALDYRRDIRVTAGRRWPLTLTAAQYQQVTGEAGFPPALAANVRDGKFDYYCNNAVAYTLRGVHVNLEIVWDWQAAPGSGDIYEAEFRGTRAVAAIRQGRPENYIPQLYIAARDPARASEVLAQVRRKVAALQDTWPGLAVEERAGEARLVIPDRFRVGHEAHFAQVARRFFEYLKSPKSLPAWERPGMLAKYYVSTTGVALGAAQPRP